ncbi:SpoIIE family protein phosphatase [Nonomuraea insulae]|uniref:SpoIIE family protein phosphatase n=1 Tax=Nonomuraea insulae TaxID=1616787 RepID=A0ABW1DCJ0_9ACTN
MTAQRHASELDEVLRHAVGAAGAHIGVIYLLSDDGQVLFLDTEIGLPAQVVKPWARLRMNAGAPAAAAVRQRQLVWAPDHQEMARRFPATALALPYPFAAAAAPIQTGDRVWGALALLWPPSHPSELASHEQESMDAACKKLGGLLGQAADSGVLPPHTGEPRVLLPTPGRTPEVGQAVAAALYLDRFRDGCLAFSLEGRITFVSASAADLLGGDVAGLLGTPLWEAAPWLKNPVFEDRCRAAVISQETTSCTVRRPDGCELRFYLYPDSTGISLRIAPVPIDQATQPHPYEPLDSSLRSLQQADVFYNFVHLATALTRALNVREIIDLFADQVMPVFKAKAMAMVIAEGDKTKVLGSRGYGSEVLDHLDGLSLNSVTPAERVLRTGEPLFFSNRGELRHMYADAPDCDDMAAWAFLPLAGSDGGIGTCVLAFAEPRPFSTEERTSLTTLAGLIATALDRALLYDAKERLAQTLQETLLPRSLPEIPGLDVAARYLPATRGVGIGGDFYDLIRLSDTLLMAVIGDVQGHNVTAAALMGQVRTAIRAHAAAGATPGEVLEHTNRLLIETETDLFTSCLLVQVDLRLRTLRTSSAGHPPPLLRPPNAPGEIIDVAPGLLLGVDTDVDYSTLEVPFPPGALLALYTDGLVETPGVDIDDAIGALAARLTDASEESLHQLSNTLLGPAPHTMRRTDDIALLLLEHRMGPP